MISTSAVSTPPRGYGGTELVVAELARALVELGHQPTVFATGDSTCAGARAVEGFPHAVWPPDPLTEMRHASAAWRAITESGDFDVAHVNHAQALPFAEWVGLPTVATIHHDRDDALTRHYAAFPTVAFAAISRRQAELVWEVPVRAVVHHGLDIERYPEGPGGETCAFLGRLASAKAPHLAIDAARRAGLPIAVGGEPHPCDRVYYAHEVAPRLDGPGVTSLGEVDHDAKVELLRHARCLVFPIQWEEPFGLVMVESMLVGTPVVAFRAGAAPEVVEEGVTGFLVDDVDAMVERIRAAATLDRRRCRDVARERWSAARMAKQYVALYEDSIARFRRKDHARAVVA